MNAKTNQTTITTKTTTTTTATRKPRKKTVPGPLNLAVAPAPATPSPSPPAGADVTSRLPSGVNLVSLLSGLVPAVSAELRAAGSFAQDFGAKIPPVTLADALDAAAKWQQARVGAEHWRDYVVRGEAAAWKPVLEGVSALGRLYASALQLDPQLPLRYPQLAALFAAKAGPSARAAKTRAAEAKAKAAVATGGATTPLAPAAQAAPGQKGP